MEALLVRRHVQNLVNAGVKPEDIAVITPYNAQVRSFHFFRRVLHVLSCFGVKGVISTYRSCTASAKSLVLAVAHHFTYAASLISIYFNIEGLESSRSS